MPAGLGRLSGWAAYVEGAPLLELVTSPIFMKQMMLQTWYDSTMN